MNGNLTFQISAAILQEFAKAVIAYQKKLNCSTALPPKPLKLDQEMENRRKIIVRSFSIAKDIYTTGRGMNPSKESELEAGAEFLEVLLRGNITKAFDSLPRSVKNMMQSLFVCSPTQY